MRAAVMTLFVLIAYVGSTATAAEPERGEKELLVRFSFSSVDFGSASGLDLGKQQDSELRLSFGWMLTDNHELGLSAGYFSSEFKDSDLLEGEDVESNGSAYGAFYHLNLTTKSSVTPFFGVSAGFIGGDMGDLYSTQYGAEVGLKLYPFEHAAFVVSAEYSRMLAEESGLPDADSVGLSGGIIINFGGWRN